MTKRARSPDTVDPRSEDERLAREALRQVAADTNAPPAARAQAARTLLELVGALGRHAPPPDGDQRALSDLSAAELRAELARVRAVSGASAAGG